MAARQLQEGEAAAAAAVGLSLAAPRLGTATPEVHPVPIPERRHHTREMGAEGDDTGEKEETEHERDVHQRLLPQARPTMEHADKEKQEAAKLPTHALIRRVLCRPACTRIVNSDRGAACLSLLLLLLYGALLWLGVRLYSRGVAHGQEGSGFGRQLASVVASAASLLAAASVASRADERALEAVVSQCARVPLRLCRWVAATARRRRRRGSSDAPASNNNDGVPMDVAVAVSDRGEQWAQPPPSRLSTYFRRVRSFVLVPLPLLLPLLFSLRVLLGPAASASAAGNALSAEINALLFALVSLASSALAAAGWALLSIEPRHARRVGRVAAAAVVAAVLYVMWALSRAQSAPMRGVLGPAFPLDPHLRLDGRTPLLDSNPHLRRLHEEAWGPMSVLAPPVSVLDSPAEQQRRYASLHCRVEPHWHLAELIPRRSANFFTGGEQCPPVPSFGRFDPVARTLTLQCPPEVAGGGGGGSEEQLTVELSPDWIAQRKGREKEVRRHHRTVVQPEMRRAEARAEEVRIIAPAAAISPNRAIPRTAAGALLLPPSGPQPLTLSTGPHSYMTARCGTRDNFLWAHVEDEAVTRRARDMMREQLFPDKQPAQSARRGDGGAPAAAIPDSVASPPPLLQNPPVLFLFFDSASRSQLLRALPRTMALMRRVQHASTSSRQAREAVYEAQSRMQRIKERQQQERGRLYEAAAGSVGKVEEEQLELQWTHELQQAEGNIRTRLAEAHSSLTSMQAATTEGGSSAAPHQYSVHEFPLYHVIDQQTKGNMQAFLCASGIGGWGGSLTESRPPPPPSQPASSRFRGKGQPIPPRHAPGHREMPCAPENVIWNRFKRAGYVTASVSSECADLVSHLWGESGVGPEYSADYDVVSPSCHPEYDAQGQWSNFVGPYSMRRRCIAGRPVHEYMLEYARSFIARYDGADAPAGGEEGGTGSDAADAAVPWFLFLSLIEGHEGSLALIATLDGPVASFLEWVLQRRHPPLIMLASDHGSHMGPFFEHTRGGKVEHKLPGLVTVIPEAWTNWRDVHHKAAALQALDAKAREEAAGAPMAPALPQDPTAPYLTLHTDPLSSSPASPHSSLLPLPASALASSLLSSSLGLALHGNGWSLLTARELYWTLRHVPARTVADAMAREERGREGKWMTERQAEAEEAVRAEVQRRSAAASEAAPAADIAPAAAAAAAPLSASQLYRRVVHALSSRLDLDLSAWTHSSAPAIPPAAAAAAVLTASAPDSSISPRLPLVRAREPVPSSLFTALPLSRRCDQAGIQEDMCVCNKEGQFLH